MARMRMLRRDGVVLSGDIMMCQFKVTLSDPEEESALFRIVADGPLGMELDAELRQAIQLTLGPEFDLRSISYRRGSLEILAIVGVVFYTASRYKNFVESLELLFSQIQRVIQNFIARVFRSTPTVTGAWSAGPGLILSESRIGGAGSLDASAILLWYVILSHAALMTMFIWQIAQSLR